MVRCIQTSGIPQAGSPFSSVQSSRLTLSGPTPVPSRPASISSIDTHVGVPPSLNDAFKKDNEGTQGPLANPDETLTKIVDVQIEPELFYSESLTSHADQDPEKLVEPSVPTSVPYPNGGWTAYAAVAGSTMVLFATFGLSTAFGVFQSYYQLNQLHHYPPSTISWIGSSHLAIAFASSLYAGRLFDLGYFKYQLAVGSLFWCLGVFALSFSSEFYQIFLSQSICMGLSLGLMFSPCLALVGTYFSTRRSLMIGICASGSAVGAIVYPILLNHLFPLYGLGKSIRYVGISMVVLLVLANLLCRQRQDLLVMRSSSNNSPPLQPILPLLITFTKEPSFWLVGLGVFGVTSACFIGLFYIVVFVKSHDAVPVLATYSLSILNATACLARIGSGLIADRFGPFNVAIPFGFIVSIMMFALLGATSIPGTLSFLLLFGLASGGFISITATCFMSLSNSISELGTRNGAGFLFCSLATLIGSPIAGALLVLSKGEYWAPCTFAGGLAFIGTGLLVGARRTQVNRKGTVWV